MTTPDPQPPPVRAHLQALLQFQAATPAAGLPQEDAATLAQRLAAFARWCQQHARGHNFSATEQAWWARVSQALLDSAMALPVVALQAQDSAGPLLHDVARLLRAEGVHEDEALELDEAIRWWQGARKAGLPVDADFGECWRALEWLALQQHLLRLAEGAGQDEARLLAAVAKVAMRYGPLKPLLRLLPAQPGAEVGAGYTF
jgi:N-acetylmuramate 1-kinase